MTLCTLCKKHYWEHDEKDLIRCGKAKDKQILELKLKAAFSKDDSHTKRLSN